MITKDFGFMILFRFYLLCFLMKTAVTIPLKKPRKKNQCFLKGKLLLSALSYFLTLFLCCEQHAE